MLELLTEREKEVLALLSQGLSNCKIQELLNISRPTVRTHISNIYAKLGLSFEKNPKNFDIRVQAVLIYLKESGEVLQMV